MLSTVLILYAFYLFNTSDSHGIILSLYNTAPQYKTSIKPKKCVKRKFQHVCNDENLIWDKLELHKNRAFIKSHFNNHYSDQQIKH